MTRKPFAVSIMALGLALLYTVGTKSVAAQSAPTVTTTIKEPLNFVGNTCDTLEPITFTGRQNTVYEVVNDGLGHLKVHIHSNWQEVSGATGSGRPNPGTKTSNKEIDIRTFPTAHT